MTSYEYCQEPSFESISGLYARPRTKRLLINGAADYKLIEVRPDFTIIMKDATLKSKMSRNGFGFAMGETPELFNFKDISQRLFDDCIPVVSSTVEKGSLKFKQVAFTGDNGARRSIYVRFQVINLHPRIKQDVKLWFTVIQKEHNELYEICNEDYLPYQTLQEPWFDGVPLKHKGNCLVQDERIVLSYKVNPEIPIEYLNRGSSGANMLKFNVRLEAGQTQVIEIIIPYEGLEYIEPDEGQDEALSIRSKYRYSASQEDELVAADFDTVLKNTVQQWKNILNSSTWMEIPEIIVQKVYNTLTLNNHQLLIYPPEKSYYIAGQGGFHDFNLVYGWESSFLLTAMDSQGYHQEVRKVLEYFLSIQDTSKGPEGDIQSPEGTFRPSIHWMCETGAIMKIFGMHYRMTKDKDWFSAVAPRLLKACNWIAEERKSTKQFNKDGTRVNHYGLLPKGRVHDWPDKGYFLFSDAYTYEGLKVLAQALYDIGHSEGKGMVQEAEDYRQCILDAVEKATHVHPYDKDNIFIVNEVYGTPEKIMTSYGLDGPVSLLDADLINPTDERVPLVELGLRQLGIMSDLYACKLYKMEDESLEQLLLRKSNGKYDLYYVNGAERIWHKVWLERGELEKALKYFYSTMAFSTTVDTGHCSERFCPQMPWLVPWQPNASGNGRIIDMIHRTLFYERDGWLNILAGAPASWLKPGNKIEVKKGITTLGHINFSIESKREKQDDRYYNIEGRFNLSNERKVLGIRISIRIPFKGKLTKALICTGKSKEYEETVIENDSIVILNPTEQFSVMCIWDIL